MKDFLITLFGLIVFFLFLGFALHGFKVPTSVDKKINEIKVELQKP